AGESDVRLGRVVVQQTQHLVVDQGVHQRVQFDRFAQCQPLQADGDVFASQFHSILFSIVGRFAFGDIVQSGGDRVTLAGQTFRAFRRLRSTEGHRVVGLFGLSRRLARGI